MICTLNPPNASPKIDKRTDDDLTKCHAEDVAAPDVHLEDVQWDTPEKAEAAGQKVKKFPGGWGTVKPCLVKLPKAREAAAADYFADANAEANAEQESPLDAIRSEMVSDFAGITDPNALSVRYVL